MNLVTHPVTVHAEL